MGSTGTQCSARWSIRRCTGTEDFCEVRPQRGSPLMATESGPDLHQALHAGLQHGCGVVLATISTEGKPSTAFCSWVLSLGNERIAVALDSRSTGHRNIVAGNTAVALEVLAEGLILSVRGTARIAKPQLHSVPFPCALVTVAIAEIRDHAVLGVHFHAPRYVWADGKEHRGEVERAIFEELRSSGVDADAQSRG